MLTPEQVREIQKDAKYFWNEECTDRLPGHINSLLRDRAEIAAELEDLKPMHDWYAAAPEGGLKCDPCCMACRLNALIERIKA